MSTLRVSTIQDTAGSNSSTPAAIANGIAKAWVNFNGTGVVAIRAQYNVSSITDNGTGDYTINFTNALADANYAITTAYRRSGGNLGDQNMVCTAPTFGTTPVTSNVRVGTTNAYGGGREDTDYLSVAIFR